MEWLFVGLIILCFFLLIVIVVEHKKREDAERELEETKKTIKKLSDAIIQKNNSNTKGRMVNEFGLGTESDYTMKDFIDGYE